MPMRTEVLARLTGRGGESLPFLPDLSLWHATHKQRGTLPDRWREATLTGVANDLGVTGWEVTRPWRLETPGVEEATSEEEGVRTTHWRTGAGELTARWSLGPDGSWWQTEYPVKSADDFGAALELVSARRYVVDPTTPAELADHRIVALEIPTRPYADLLYDLVGMSDGPILLAMGYPEVGDLLRILEEKLQSFLPRLLAIPADVAYSPDNLDRQFIAPAVFDEHLADSYGRTVATLGETPLVVHAGGPVRDLLAPLKAAGVKAVEGVCGPPQSDASLSESRVVAGDGLALWGGIAQDMLLDTHDRDAFEKAVADAVGEARGDDGMILGVADRVPVEARIDRLEAIVSRVRSAS
jgi:hypothetical protein